jgi:hypothetical protein
MVGVPLTPQQADLDRCAPSLPGSERSSSLLRFELVCLPSLTLGVDFPPLSDGRKLRVLCIYGSESGNAKRGIDRWVKKWSAREGRRFEIVDTRTGNEVAKSLATGGGQAMAKNLEFLAQNYDVLLVATSSYGDGDPPSNMRELTAVLSHEVRALCPPDVRTTPLCCSQGLESHTKLYPRRQV